ncbi:hypothetical protein BGX24_004688, partial [Mortierella sp. AD032]
DDSYAPLSPTEAMSSEEEEEEEEEEELEFSELDSDLGSDSGLESDWGTDSGSDSNSGSVGSAELDKDVDFGTSTSASDGDNVDSTNLLNPSWSLDTDSETVICSDEEGPWLDDEEAHHLQLKCQRMKKASDPDPCSFVATVGSMLAFMQSQRSNYLQMMMGLHLRVMSCPKQLINLLNTMGLSMCYTTTTRALKALAGDHSRLLRKLRSYQFRNYQFRNYQFRNYHPIFFLYDNFNQARKVRHQTKDHQASFLSGTTSTIVVGESIGEELLPVEEVPEAVVADIKLTKDDTKHFKVFYRHHLSKALKPELKKGSLFKALAIPPIKVLTSRPTEAYELAAMEIDQSSVSGNLVVFGGNAKGA